MQPIDICVILIVINTMTKVHVLSSDSLLSNRRKIVVTNKMYYKNIMGIKRCDIAGPRETVFSP